MYNPRKWKTAQKNITRAVSSFNRKLNRLKKKNPEIAEFLPETVTTNQFMKNYEKRSDFIKELNDIKQFNKKNAEKLYSTSGGEKITKYEFNLYKKYTKRANVAREIEYRKNKQEILDSRNNQYSVMGRIDENIGYPLKVNLKNLKKGEFKKRLEVRKRQSEGKDYYSRRKEIFYNNFKKSLNYGNEINSEILNLLEDVDTDEFYDYYLNSYEELLPSLNYPIFSDDEEFENRGKRILEEIQTIKNEIRS